VSVEIAGQAVQAVAKDRTFHPVCEYLDALSWDGIKRIDTWLSVYLGAEATDYTTAVGARWLMSAVARIYRPGVKADCCLILEGSQGLMKSMSLKTIAGPYFTDEIADLGSKDSAMQTRGVWIIEIAELDSMTRSEVGRIKAFMSRSTDRFRPPYGKRLIESPRQCVFAGSVNHSTYLRDETGGRRFWPVACTRILIEDLARDRDQLWAESQARQFRDVAVVPDVQAGANEIDQFHRSLLFRPSFEEFLFARADGAVPKLLLHDLQPFGDLLFIRAGTVAPQQEFHNVGRHRILAGILPHQILPNKIAVEG
jgi:predicted P-loop ATPase